MKKVMLILAIIATAFLAFWLFTSTKLVYLSFQDSEDLYGENFDIKAHGTGGRIVADISYSLGDCAYETLTTTKNGSTTSSSTTYYFVIPAYSTNDDVYYIAVEVKQEDYRTFNSITNNSWEYLETGDFSCLDKTVTVEGTLDDFDEELYGYMIECFEEIDFYETDEELKAHVLPIVLTPMNYDAATGYLITSLVTLALVIVFWALFFIALSKEKAKEAALKEQYEQYRALNPGMDPAMDPAMNPSAFIVIGGVTYPKQAVAHINTYVANHETIVAANELVSLTGISLPEATEIISNWPKYYNR